MKDECLWSHTNDLDLTSNSHTRLCKVWHAESKIHSSFILVLVGFLGVQADLWKMFPKLNVIPILYEKFLKKIHFTFMMMVKKTYHNGHSDMLKV